MRDEIERVDCGEIKDEEAMVGCKLMVAENTNEAEVTNGVQ